MWQQHLDREDKCIVEEYSIYFIFIYIYSNINKYLQAADYKNLCYSFSSEWQSLSISLYFYLLISSYLSTYLSIYLGIPVYQYPVVPNCVLLTISWDYPSYLPGSSFTWQIRPLHHDSRYIQVNSRSEVRVRVTLGRMLEVRGQVNFWSEVKGQLNFRSEVIRSEVS